jgi:hypothetical protein
VTYKERDKDGTDHSDQCAEGGPLVSESIGDWSGSKDSDESTTLSSLEKGTLPFSFNDPFSIELDTESFLESG